MNTPNNATDSQIHALFEEAAALSRKQAEAAGVNPELFFSTRKRHRPDIFECCNCGHQFPAEVECPSCGSRDSRLFMRAPSRDEVRAYAVDSETALTEIDPDWREHFGGDADRALEFYGRKR